MRKLNCATFLMSAKGICSITNPYKRQAKAEYEASPPAEELCIPLRTLHLDLRKQQEDVNYWGKKLLLCVQYSKVIGALMITLLASIMLVSYLKAM